MTLDMPQEEAKEAFQPTFSHLQGTGLGFRFKQRKNWGRRRTVKLSRWPSWSLSQFWFFEGSGDVITIFT
jgi:hypothetical protein